MLLFKNGRFYSEKVSFIIPDGFYFEDDPDVIDEYGLCAWDPKKEFLFCWRFCEDCMGTARELESWFLPDCGMVPLSEIAPIQINGLSGHRVFYRTRQAQYYEARFALEEGRELVLLVEGQGRDVRKMAASPEFEAALYGIRGE